MKKALRILLVLVAVLALAAIWQRERIARLSTVITLFDEGRIVGNFTSMDAAFETTAMPLPDAAPNRLPQGAPVTMPAGYEAWAAERAVTGIVVLKDGVVRHEAYPLTSPRREDDPSVRTRISWSVAKSFLSVLFGVVYQEGAIDSLDDPVTKYAPDLAGTAYDGTSIRHVLQMSSGVVFDEDYLDFWSDINRMGRVLALGRSMDRFAAGLDETFVEPGTDWQYVSIDTHVIGMVIRGATGRPIPELLNEKVLQPLRLTVEPYYVTDGHGVAFVLGGLNMTTHDYALFGHMVASGGIAFGQRIVSDSWLTESTRASAPTDPGDIGYGYQWWIPVGAKPGQFMGRGIYGQYLYVDRPRGVVIAVNGADRAFRETGVNEQNVEMFRRIAEALE
ncbi:MAG: serine hydrolase [Alphaproteobacteria bacterium]|jgi:CubicO group peptidase (beta-lactamase class C family)|nr:serine hydrolase [Alphaproteobacteria bacterium]